MLDIFVSNCKNLLLQVFNYYGIMLIALSNLFTAEISFSKSDKDTLMEI